MSYWSCVGAYSAGWIVGAATRVTRAQSTKDRAYAIADDLTKSGVWCRSAVRELAAGGVAGARAAARRGREDAHRDVIDVTKPIDLDEQTALAVHRDQRLGLATVDVLPVDDRLLR